MGTSALVRVSAALFAAMLLACTRSPPSSSTVHDAASSTDLSSSASSGASGTSAPAFGEWEASDARKSELLPHLDEVTRVLVASRVVKVTPEESPFLAEGRMFILERTARADEPMVHHPSFFHLAQLPAKGARGLRVEEDWEWLRTNAKVVLEPEENRVAYVARYVSVLSSYRTRYAWIVKTVDELQLLTSADADAMPRAGSEAEAAKARALRERYSGVIKPLSLPGQSPWRGALFANGRHHLIVRVDVVLAADGRITLTDTVLEKDAPIPGVDP